MDAHTLVLMISASIFLGALGLVAFIWGLKTGQFDDQDKMMQGVLFDGEEELNDAAKQQEKQQEYHEKAQQTQQKKSADAKDS